MSAETTINELGQYAGTEVTLRGWLFGKRSGGKIVFLLMRDGTGVCQCVAEVANAEVFKIASELTHESSFSVTGIVRAEPRAAGGWEIAVRAIEVIHRAEEYPIARKAHGIDFLLAHRHLWLRAQRQTALLKIRHTVIEACRRFFDDRGFTLVDSPILVKGAGEEKQSLFPVDYFGEKLFLTQTGQLHLESACMALRKVYCFGPTFRAEKSKTRRHLTEFWMIEPEVAFAELDDIMALAEDMICVLVEKVLAKHEADLLFLGRDVESLRKVKKPFPRMTYSEAAENLRSDNTSRWLEQELERERAGFALKVEELRKLEEETARAGKGAREEKLQKQAADLRDEIRDKEEDLAARPGHMELARSFRWGKDLGGSDETIISRQHDRPVFVTDYPKEAKAFYMKMSADGRTVRNFDLLAPEGYGEIIGGSQREENLDVLLARMREAGLDPADYAWYLDLRRYGSVPHGGFGLGIERALTWLCGLRHVREAIPFPRTMGRIDI